MEKEPPPQRAPSLGAPGSDFVAPRLLRNGHAMTLAAAFWPRRFPALPPAELWLAEVAPQTRLRLDCHWQARPDARPALVLVHGLEGSSDSSYMLGTAEKAWQAGFNVVRMNLRNCGGTEHLTPTLYHSGLSEDVRAVAARLTEQRRMPEVHLTGFSLGGNQVLKLAAEWSAAAPAEVASIAAVCPALDLAACADALERPANWLYQRRFLRGLKTRLRRKALLFPALYSTDGLARARTLREFDDRFTAPLCGFGTAENYYRRASALPLAAAIRLPTLILTAQDDPFVPFASFRHPSLRDNPSIALLAPPHGGHVGFLARGARGRERFWAERRITDFSRSQSRVLG